jgi:signal transduction histidine kinase
MQEYGVGSMNLVGTDNPFLWGASCDKKNGDRTANLRAAPALCTDELTALEHAQQAHVQSIMVLVHELRSPAAASKSMVATLRYMNPQDARLDRFLTRIEKRMDQMLDLVEDILDLSRARAGRPLGQAVTLDLVAQTRATCQPYQEDAKAKGLTMGVELPTSSIWVRMPERAYHLIVSNLISNAVKYTTAGSVRVTLRKTHSWAVLAVQDTGIGIPPEEISQLFNEFFRASNARDSRTPGTGLGLAAVKALVEGCNGELELQSQEGRGSKFTVRLPLCQVEAIHGAESRLRAETNVQ